MSNIVIHNHSNRNYIALSIAHLRDTSLSWQAMGMLSFMLSCREDFKLSIEGLHKCSSCGDAATRSALKELRDKRYVIVSPVKQGGRIMAWNYDVYETPHVENPNVENPHVENQAQSNNIIEEIASNKLEAIDKDNNLILFNEESSTTIPPIAPRKTKHFVKPTLEQVTAYCNERHNSVDPQRFIDFYESKGWMVGSNHMKDWKAAVRTWENKNKQTNQNAYGNTYTSDAAADAANQPRQRDYSKRF